MSFCFQNSYQMQRDRLPGAVTSREESFAAKHCTRPVPIELERDVAQRHPPELADDLPLSFGFALRRFMAQREIERRNACRRVAQVAAFRERRIEDQPV